ncbi:hypothetical protein LTR10_012460 [Elasticomyces elasticus]|nr:hypothetical protein LTR10_012460 [Elasticomyces elasticus]KAK4965935.1 hypothetical protein LTR42_011949 [Elasticomyces elasticus]
MPSALSSPSRVTKDGILLPLIDAHLNGSLGKDVFDFATTLFGADAVDEMEKEGKEERKEAFPANGAGEVMVCRSLMRAYVALRKLGEGTNAEELRAIADKHYSKETVDDELTSVIMGR